MQPDWDMFQSGHEFGAYHAAGRAVSGGPVYVSDKPGSHDFALLNKLVCHDGRVLRCDGPGRPTYDTLCHDPTRENVLLKIRNTCGKAGVVGAFNAQTRPAAAGQAPIHGDVGPRDVPGLEGRRFAAFAHVANRLDAVGRDTRLGLALGYRGYEIVTFAPVEHGFAAVGLADKMNSAGAIARQISTETTLEVQLYDGGEFVAWVQRPPKSVEVDGRPATFQYEVSSGELRVAVPTPAGRPTTTLAVRCPA
jgi:raffinose synthase